MSDYQPILSGHNIYLREVRIDDVNEEYYAWMNDPEINQFMETRFIPQSIERIKQFVASKDGKADEVFFAICDQQTNKHIGNIKLGPINQYHRRGDISLLVGDKDYWGKGVASEAIALVCQFAFERLSMNKLQAGAYEGNQGSIKAFIRNGFTKEGEVAEYVLVAGQGINLVLLGLTASQYFAGK